MRHFSCLVSVWFAPLLPQGVEYALSATAEPVGYFQRGCAYDPRKDQMGNKIFGRCWCDTNFSTDLGHDRCNRACASNDPEICGGVDALSVYEATSTPTTAAPTTAAPTTAAPTTAVPTTAAPAEPTSVPTEAMGVGYYKLGCAYNPSKDVEGMIIPRIMQDGPFKKKVAGSLEMSAECFCDTDFSTDLGYDKCNRVCAGNDPEICGGPFALTVYAVGFLEPTPSPTPAPTPEGCEDVIIEAEDILRNSLVESLWGGWGVYEDQYASNGEFISWRGLGNVNQNNQNFAQGNPMYYEVDIPFPDTFKFLFVLRQPPGIEASDKGNDAWVVFNDAARYGPLDENDEPYPNYPNNVNNEGFVKVFGYNTGPAFQEGAGVDVAHQYSDPAVVFDVAGNTTMGLAGRSDGLEIDQIILRPMCEW